MHDLLVEIRHAIRTLRRSPIFTITALVVLGIGTGAAGAMFGIVYRLLFDPLELPRRDRLVTINEIDRAHGESRGSIAAAPFLAYRSALAPLATLEAWENEDAVLRLSNGAERLIAAGVTPGFFSTLGVPPSAGRDLVREDALTGSEPVALVSERWARTHGGRALIGGVFPLDGVPTRIVGLLPTENALPLGADLWRPLRLDGERALDREARTLSGIARLHDGVSLSNLRAAMRVAAERDAQTRLAADRGLETQVLPISVGVQDPISPLFEMFVSLAVLFAVLLAAANLAGLQLARAAARRHEWAVRAALGGSRGRLLRQALVETLVLTAGGAAIGLLVARLTLRAVLAAVPANQTRFIPGWAHLSLDGPMLVGLFAVAALTAIAFGLLPAWQASRVPAALALRSGHGGALGLVRARARSVLVVVEVALSVVLLAGAALMVAGFRHVSGPDQGYDFKNLLVFRVAPGADRLSDPASRIALHQRLLERLAALPGLESVALLNRVPSSGSASTVAVEAEGRTDGALRPIATSIRVASPGALAVLRLPLVRGREFVSADDTRGAPVAVINEAFARRAWSGLDPLGRIVRFEDASGVLVERRVVGVARDVKRNWFEVDMAPMVYVPDAQWGARSMQVIVRTYDDPLAHAPAVRRAIAALDPELPLESMTTLEQFLGDQLSGVRVGTVIMSWLGVFALLLTAIGLHGVVAFHVARRTPELALRMALGARREDVVALVLAEASRLAMWGLGAGVPLALAMGWAMTRFLFGAARPSALSLAGMLGALLVSLLLASLVPAWRASRLDPMAALRSE